ncbi:MAG: hypothetical protein WD875_18215 [Pirellulales bacterium]
MQQPSYASSTPAEYSPPPGWTTRFSWPMRAFLLLFLFDMFARGVLTLMPCDDWQEEFDLPTYPKPLPTASECGQINEGRHPDGYTSVAARLGECFQSAGRHMLPWPTPGEREKIDSAAAAGRYAAAWTATRCRFVGRLVGIDHGWPMFSPNVGTSDTVARVRLVYADGSFETLHTWADPPDLTRYSRWWYKRPLHMATKLDGSSDARRGFSNWVAHKFAENAAGSPLVRIDYYKIEFDYPPPSADAAAFLADQTEAHRELSGTPFWSYDVAKKSGTWNR